MNWQHQAQVWEAQARANHAALLDCEAKLRAALDELQEGRAGTVEVVWDPDAVTVRPSVLDRPQLVGESDEDYLYRGQL